MYFSRSSLERGALMMLRRTLEGASKCALRDLRREEWRAVERRALSVYCLFFSILERDLDMTNMTNMLLTLLNLGHCDGICREDWAIRSTGLAARGLLERRGCRNSFGFGGD